MAWPQEVLCEREGFAIFAKLNFCSEMPPLFYNKHANGWSYIATKTLLNVMNLG